MHVISVSVEKYQLPLNSRLVTWLDHKFRAAYNKCIKKLFGYVRCDSMSGILIELGLPAADTIVHNSHVLFASQSINQSINQFI